MAQSKREYEKTIPVLGKKEFEKQMQEFAFMLERKNKQQPNQKKK